MSRPATTQGALALDLPEPVNHPLPPRRRRAPKTAFEQAMDAVWLDSTLGGPGGFLCWRDEFVRRFSWGALSGSMVRTLAPWGPFLEVGAGSGYWAFELARAGADVVATGLADPVRVFTKCWHPVEPLSALAAVRTYPGRTLLSVWPEEEPWAGEALAEHRRQGGQAFAYMGQWRKGCTGDDGLFDELDAHWVQASEVPSLSWHGIDDRLWIFRRKGA